MNNTIYREIIKIINRLIKYPRNEIEEMISILEKTPSYSIKFPLERYFDLDEQNILKKIRNKNLKELLELVLSIKIIREFCKDIKECKEKLYSKKEELKKQEKELKIKQKEYINELIKQIEEKDKRLNYLEKKQSNLDQLIQEQIAIKLKHYERKIKILEEENKKLKNILNGEF